jgi:hypothetical protein
MVGAGFEPANSKRRADLQSAVIATRRSHHMNANVPEPVGVYRQPDLLCLYAPTPSYGISLPV